MKVCLVTGIFPPDIGGPATYVSKLADYLYSIGWLVEIVTYADSAENINLPFTLHKIVRNRSTLRKYFQTRSLIKKASSGSNIAYINGLLVPASSALATRNIPKVAKIVGDPVWERAQNIGLTEDNFEKFQASRQSLKIRFLRSLRDRSLRRMDKIIVPSDFLRKTVEAWGFGGKVETIYNGIAPDYGKEFLDLKCQDAKKHLGLGGWVIMSVGRLCRWKGFDAVIRCLKKLQQNINLVIVGDGPEKEKLVEIARSENLANRVTFAGRVNHERLPLYLRAADCFILNSGYEGFPHIILEAMAMECPVAASKIGGTPELIQDGVNGILFEKDDFNAIISGIMRIHDDSLFRSSIIKNGIKSAQIFNWDATVKKTVTLLKSMV